MIEYVLNGECERVKDVPKDAVIVSVDGKMVEGQCEACGKPLCEGDDMKIWADGIVTCKPECAIE